MKTGDFVKHADGRKGRIVLTHTSNLADVYFTDGTTVTVFQKDLTVIPRRDVRTHHIPQANAFTLNIQTDGGAFEEDANVEIARILRDVARRLEDGDSFATFQTLRDVNGNDVGRAAHKHRDSKGELVTAW